MSSNFVPRSVDDDDNAARRHCLAMNHHTNTQQQQQKQRQQQQFYDRYSNKLITSSSSSSASTDTALSLSSCPPPYITPTLQNRPRLSLANAQALLCMTSADIERDRRLIMVHQEQKSQGISSASSTASPSSTIATLPTNQYRINPLDLLSAVSSQVASHERSDQQQKWNPARDQRHAQQQYQQQLDAHHRHHHHPPPPPLHHSSTNTANATSSYIGQRNSSGQRHGHGVLIYPNGCQYNGCFHNDKRHGFGKCYYPNGCIYTGFWANGKRDGVGKMLYADRGDMYEGEWKEDQRHGRGIYYRLDGRADVARYLHHDTMVGEGTQWSPNREFVVRLVGGKNMGQIAVEEALEICQRMGVPGVPKRYDNWANNNNSISCGSGDGSIRSQPVTQHRSATRDYSNASI